MEKLIGQTIKDYELCEYVAGGGFGDVYRARQLSVQRDVAMKVITPRYANQPDFIRRFEAEAQIIARLESPYIVPLYNYWREPDGAYLVMRWLGGGSLYNRLHSQGALSIEEAVDVINNVTKALHIAHRNQVIHRDIKPGNILLDDDDYAYLTDFGIAKDHARAEAMTEDGMLMGTFDYLAPEQAQSDAVMPATDVYSLGIVLYEMLEGHHPFPKASHIEMLYKNLNESLPDITVLDVSIRDSVNAVIQKATDKNPERRYQDVLTFAQALRQAAQLDATPVLTSPIELLTPREQDVLKLMLAGKTNRQIADSLVVELATIKGYNTNIYRKLGVRSKGQALAKARQMEWFTGKRLAPPSTSLDLLPEPQNPYKGLEEFQAGDAHNFFGRKRITEKLLQRMCEDVPYYRFLAVVGPSGSGKSSLVRAGLTPALWRGDLPDSDNWYITDMLPGSHPLDKLEVALVKVADNKTLNLRDQLSRDARGLLRVADMMLPDDDSELLIVIDQFEEVFTLVEDEADRQHFLALLHTAMTDNRSRVRVVVTLRADYYDRPLMYPDFGDMLRQRVETVLPLNAEELEQAITAPVKQQAVKFEAGLVSRIVADVNYQPGALPLLQYALTELFERRDGRMLTMEAYQAIGGTGGALAKRADEIYLEGNEIGQELVRQLFLRLVTLGEGVEDTRRRVERAELLAIAQTNTTGNTPTKNDDTVWAEMKTEMMDEIIDVYAASRLLSLDHDPYTHQPTVEVAHEAILREWDRLRQWLNANRDDIRQQRIVAQAAADWDAHGQDSSFLLRGIRLEQAEKWHKTSALNLTPLESEYVAASIAQRKYETDLEITRIEEKATQEKRSRDLLRALVAVFAIATLVSIGFGIFAWNRQNVATDALEASNQSAAEFRSIALSFGAKDALENEQPDVALALANEAININNPPIQAKLMFSRASISNWMLQRFTGGHEARLEDADFLVGGQNIVTTGSDGRVNIWNIASGEIVKSIQDEGSTSRIAVHPDGQLIAVEIHGNERLLVWNIETDDVFYLMVETDSPTGHQSPVFNHDGSLLVTASGGTVYVWDVATWELLRSFVAYEDDRIWDISFSDDYSLLMANCGTCVEVRIMDFETGEILQKLEHPQGEVFTIAWASRFLPDGEHILTGVGSLNGGIYLWNWRTAEIIWSDNLVNSWVQDIAVSPDGRWFAISTDGNTADTNITQLREVETGHILHNYYGSVGERDKHVEFSADGQTVLTASQGGTAILWTVIWEGALSVQELPAPVTHFALHPTEPILVGGSEYYAELYTVNYETGEVISTCCADNPDTETVDGHQESTRPSAFSLDGKYLASSEWSPSFSENSVFVWDSVSGDLLSTLSTDNRDTAQIAFSPTEPIVALAEGNNFTITFWNLETGAFLKEFEHISPVYTIVYSPDGRYIYSGLNDGSRFKWDVNTGEVVWQYRGSYQGAGIGDVDSTGSRLLDPNGEIVFVRDTDSGDVLMTLAGHVGTVWSAEFSPDEQTILTTSADFSMGLWDAATGEMLRRYAMYNAAESFVASFSPDGHHIISTIGNLLITWDASPLPSDPETWVKENRYIPDFTCEQRDLYHIEPLCEEQ